MKTPIVRVRLSVILLACIGALSIMGASEAPAVVVSSSAGSPKSVSLYRLAEGGCVSVIIRTSGTTMPEYRWIATERLTQILAALNASRDARAIDPRFLPADADLVTVEWNQNGAKLKAIEIPAGEDDLSLGVREIFRLSNVSYSYKPPV